MPSDSKKKREQKKKEAAKKRDVKKPSAASDNVSDADAAGAAEAVNEDQAEGRNGADEGNFGGVKDIKFYEWEVLGSKPV